jgi:hypothetical protein
MGNTFEISVWKMIDWKNEYGYEEFWRGENCIMALYQFIKAKREGYGCVTLHWR